MGASAIIPMSVPIVIALGPLFVSGARAKRGVGFLMSGLTLILCIVSFGPLLFPSFVALAVAAGRTPATAPADQPDKA
jgi:cytochrome bd-type quinol oxidase subunit 2